MGVQSQNVQRLIFENSSDVTVLRVKKAFNWDLDEIEYFARSRIGTRYSKSEASKVIRKKHEYPVEPNRQFCTRFVSKAFLSGGLKIVENTSYPSPEDILNSDTLSIIEGVTTVANEAEKKFATSNNPLNEHAISFKNIIEESSKKLKKEIIDFNHLLNEVYLRKEIDKLVLEIIQNSGFLNFIERDLLENPENYDVNRFINAFQYDNSLPQKLTELLAIETSLKRRYNTVLEALESYNNDSPRLTFKELIKLYSKLIIYSKQRENTYYKVIRLLNIKINH